MRLLSLKNHPFAVEAFFDFSVVLTFSVPKKQIQNLIPPCLNLDTCQNEYAFIAAAFVQTKHLRPKGFPKFLGNNFFLVGYRIFVTYKTSEGKKLRGLYILKSQTNKTLMKILGNTFTHYNYSLTQIDIDKNETFLKINSKSDTTFLIANLLNTDPQLPKNSIFKNWKEARRYAGPLPHTFTYNEITNEVLIIEGNRENWIPKPIKILDYNIDFVNKLKINECNLSSAFIIENVPYCWKKGKIDLWKNL